MMREAVGGTFDDGLLEPASLPEWRQAATLVERLDGNEVVVGRVAGRHRLLGETFAVHLVTMALLFALVGLLAASGIFAWIASEVGRFLNQL